MPIRYTTFVKWGRSKIKEYYVPKMCYTNFKEEIEMDRDNVWTTYNDETFEELHRINESYKSCLDEGKTERECVKIAVRMAR